MALSRGIWPFAAATVLLGVITTTAADARSGHTSGHTRAPASAGGSVVTPAARANASISLPAALTAPAAGNQPAATTTQVPISSLNAAIARPSPSAPPAPTPSSVIAAPATPPAPVAALSFPIPSSTAQGSGGSSGVALPGGGHEGLKACMEFWDRETHMTKAEWKTSCQQSIHRLEGVKVDAQMPEWLMRR
jgi:hypothetical protein